MNTDRNIKKASKNSDSSENRTEDDILADIQKRREARKRKKQRMIIIFICILAVIGMFGFSMSSYFTVDGIEVEGNHYFSDDEIINMAHATTGHNLIYKLPKKSIIDYLE